MTTQLKLDHLVYGVPDLESATEEFRAELGVAPVFGGRHEGVGTHNAILPLEGERYVELMAIDPSVPAPDGPRPFGLDTLTKARLVAWAVRSFDIDADAKRAGERGYDPGIVFAMSRKEPSGNELRWKLSLQREPIGDGLVPFVIDWGDATHPSANPPPGTVACTLSNFSARHPEPQLVRDALSALGVELEVEHGASSALHARISGPAGSIDLGPIP